MIRVVGVSPYAVVVPILLAVVVALALTLFKPVMGIQIAAGLLILLLAFVSERIALYLLIFSMLLSPELAVGQIEGHGVGGRPITLRLDDFLLLAIGLGWFVRTSLYRGLPLFKWTPINRPITYYMIASIIATLFGVLMGRVNIVSGLFFLLKYFEFFLVFFMVVNYLTTKDEVLRFTTALLITCFLVSLYAILQIPFGHRATAPFEGKVGEPNTLGGYLVFMMAISAGLLFHVQSRRIQVVMIIFLGAAGLGVMATLSRSSYLAVAVLMLAIAITQRHRPWVVGSVIATGLLVVVLAPDNVKERILFTFSQPDQPGQVQIGNVRLDTSTTERIRSWQYVFENWLKRPVFGYGVTGYAWADAQYVKTLGETGLLGLGAFLFMIRRVWRMGWDAFRVQKDPFSKGLAYGFLMGLVALLVHAIGANTFIIVRIMEPFWFFAGMVMVLVTLTPKAGKEHGSSASA